LDFVTQYGDDRTKVAALKVPSSVSFKTTAAGYPHHTNVVEGGALANIIREFPKDAFLHRELDEEYLLDADEATPWDEVIHKGLEHATVESLLPNLHGKP